jgi:rod shape-determining protein MreD
MIDHGGLDRGRSKASRYPLLALIAAPLVAILFQVYVPLFFAYLGYLELPLLVTLYFAMMRRRPVGGLLYGAIIGLAQDSLSHQPLGLFGIVKTLVGYFGAGVGLRFEVDNPAARFTLAFFFFVFHQFFYWVLSGALLGAAVDFSVVQTLLLGVMNAAVAVPLFHLLDRLKETT